MKALQAYFAQTGGPEVIRWHEVDLPEPGPGEILVRHEAVGLNFIDTYYRSGLYPCPLPSGLGSEAAGVVEAVGADVAAFKPGDRVATLVRRWAPMPRRGFRPLRVGSAFPMASPPRWRRRPCLGMHRRISGRTGRVAQGG
jgi:NADPH:quinone reductase-like Zn-dependent oxidoreductase